MAQLCKKACLLLVCLKIKPLPNMAIPSDKFELQPVAQGEGTVPYFQAAVLTCWYIPPLS